MRIVDLATFLLPLRFSLSDLMAGGGSRLKAALSAEFGEFGAPQPIQSEVLLDYHRSVGAMSMESMVFAGETSIPGLDRVQLYLSSLSIGFVVISFDVPDDLVVDLESTGPRDTFKAVELEVATHLMPVIRRCCERVLRAAPRDLVGDRPLAALPAATLLWWHRVAVDPLPGREFPAARWYGVEAELADGVRATVGNGFTNIHGARSRQVVDDVVEGLMVATQEWLIVDEAKRLLADHLVRLSQSRNRGLISVDAQYHELLELTEEVTLRNLHIAEEVRYLANARSKVKEAAAQAWRMQQEAAELEQRTSALTGLFALHRDRIFNDRDERRNRLVFVFTAVTLVQSALVWYDFITGDDTTIGGSPRTWIAWTVLLLTVLAVGGAIGFRLGNEWWRRVVAQRMERATKAPVSLLRIPTRDEVDANEAASASQWAASPTQPTASPAQPTATPAQPTATPAQPTATQGARAAGDDTGGDPDSGGRPVAAR